MKKVILTLVISFLVHSVYAQTRQDGFVQEYNERNKRKPLAGVELLISNANRDVTGQKGDFHLTFRTLKPGDPVRVQQIIKSGYEIFNKEQLEVWRIANNGEPFTIVLCKSSKFKALKDQYNAIAYKSYCEQRDRELKQLEDTYKAGQIKEEQYEQQILDICQYYDSKLDNLDTYIDRFARIDLSQITRDERRIITLVSKGQIQEAIDAYNAMKLDEKLIRNYQEYQQTDSAIVRLKAISKSKHNDEDALLASLKNKYDLMMIQGRRETIDSILVEFENIVEQCPNSYKIMMAFVDFAMQEHHLSKVTKWGRILIDILPDAPMLRQKYCLFVTNAESTLGNDEMARLYRDRASEYVLQAIDQGLPGAPKAYLALQLNQLFDKIISGYDKAAAIQDANRLFNFTDSIYNDNKNDDVRLTYYDCKFTLCLAMSEIYDRLRDSEKYCEYVKLGAAYADSSATIYDNLESHKLLIDAYNQLGVMHMMLQEYDEAEACFLKYRDYLNSSYEEYPYQLYAQMFANYYYPGMIHYYRGELDLSLNEFQKGIQLAELVLKTRPYTLYFTTYAELQNNVGYINYVQGNLAKAEETYLRCIELAKPYAERNPIKHLSALCIPQINLAMIKLTQRDLEGYERLQSDYSENNEKLFRWLGNGYLNSYVVALDNKGYYELLRGNTDEALQNWDAILKYQPAYLDVNPYSLLYKGLKEQNLINE